VYGYSAGALLALRTASRSSRITGLVVLEPPLHDDNDPRPDPLTVELTELIAHDDRAGAVRRFHEAIGVPDEFVAEMSASPSWPAMIAAAHTVVYDCMISDAVDRELLAGVAPPTLVLDSAGSSDDLTGWAADVAVLLPNASHRSLPGEWHAVADDVLAPVIVDHITATCETAQP
jgi:pimeloyl-ACP methyl ester carboxylesterase